MTDSTTGVDSVETAIPVSPLVDRSSSVSPSSQSARDFQSGKLEEDVVPTYIDVLQEKALDSLEVSPFGLPGVAEGAIPRALNQATSRLFPGDGAKLTKEEANKRYPELPKPFSGDVYPEEAALIASRNQRLQSRQAWVGRYRGEIGLGTDLLGGVASVLDPSTILMGPAISGAGKLIGLAATASRTAAGARIAEQIAAARAAKGIAAVVGKEAVENVVQELPGLAQAGNENQTQDVMASVANVVAGTILGTGIHYGAEKLRFTRTIPESLDRHTAESAVIQSGHNARVDVSPATDVLRARAAGETLGPRNPHEFRDISHPSELHFYAAVDPDTATRAVLGRRLSEDGFDMDSDLSVAKNRAGTPESPYNGEVQRFSVSEDAKVLNMDDPLPPEILDRISKEIEPALKEKTQADIAVIRDSLSGVSGREALDYVSDIAHSNGVDPDAVFGQIAKENGYHIAHYVEDVNGNKTNRVFVFDESKINLEERTKASVDTVPAITPEKAIGESDRVNAPDRQRFHDAEAQREIENGSKESTTIEQDMKLIEEEGAIARADLEELSKTDPEIAAELARHDVEYEKSVRSSRAAELLADCLTGETLK